MPKPAAARSATPLVLLVEDDPTSRAFLAGALRAVAVEVDSADSAAAATTLADAQDYDLWLFDANLPDGDGSSLLAQLRPDHPDTPAIAHTASNADDNADRLRAAGFCDVLIKPLPALAVQAAVRRALGLPAADAAAASTRAGSRPVWDDEAAAIALNGNRAHIDTLRGLFLDELPQARQRIAAAARAGEVEAMRSDLHKLRASCGFVGAARLAEISIALQQQPLLDELLQRFDEIAGQTLDYAARAATATPVETAPDEPLA